MAVMSEYIVCLDFNNVKDMKAAGSAVRAKMGGYFWEEKKKVDPVVQASVLRFREAGKSTAGSAVRAKLGGYFGEQSGNAEDKSSKNGNSLSSAVYQAASAANKINVEEMKTVGEQKTTRDIAGKAKESAESKDKKWKKSAESKDKKEKTGGGSTAGSAGEKKNSKPAVQASEPTESKEKGKATSKSI
jgi:hypothetical protein